MKSPFLLFLLHSTAPFVIIWKAWGYSSAGRAFEWHSKGQRFDPAYLHHVFNPPHLSDVVLFILSPHRSKWLIDSMRHFVPLKSVPYLTGSIPLISTTYLIHHICPMWFFLFFPLTAISDSLDSMRHFVPLKSVPYLTGLISIISTTHLIHHICPMWFFLFFPLTAVSDSSIPCVASLLWNRFPT